MRIGLILTPVNPVPTILIGVPVNVGTSGKCKLSYSAENQGVGMSNGVGADPS